MTSRGGGRTPSGGGAESRPRRSPRLTPTATAQPRINVQQLRKQKKAAAAAAAAAASAGASPKAAVFDPLAPCDAAAEVRRGATGLVYDERMLEHRCLWDDDFPEGPDRLQVIFDKCSQLGLVDRCQRVPARHATEEELQLCHSPEHIQRLRQLCERGEPEQLRQEADKHDSVYLHPATFQCASLAAGSALELTDQVLDGKLQNGFAIVRPPGHHAEPDEFSGYCFFNNVALAARHAANRGKRVLIVDWDVHHGQGTQEMFYFDQSVLYFSVHRYDGGAYWPGGFTGHWERSGAGAGAGLNWNVPLDGSATDSDLLAVWHRLLLPAAYQFAPDLVIVSAGFDMALGDPKGCMAVTPACFAHLTHALLALSSGRLVAVLEGGYCRPALAAAAAHTLAALLGEPPPPLPASLPPPSESVSTAIRHVMCAHRATSPFLGRHGTFSASADEWAVSAPDCHWPPPARPPRQVGPNPAPPPDALERLNRLLLVSRPLAPAHRVCLATNEDMMRHRNVDDPDHPERPERLQSILTRLSAWGLSDRCLRTPGQLRVSPEQLVPPHEPAHVAALSDTEQLSQSELDRLADRFNSVFLCPESYDCALLAAGCVVEAVDSVLSGESGSGLCVVRPPGHHAEPDTPHGFCLFNNVAVAARHAVSAHGLRRVMILDWDVHHGNGIQHMFYEDSDVLYMSLHRHDFGFFFPMSDDGDHDRVGSGPGAGFNVNVPWNRARMGAAEYLAALLAVVLPVGYQFSPELVLVSAGFDAARGDPLGGYLVPPEVYGHLTHHLTALAGGRVVVALEGGYNLTSISYSMAMCARALLGDPAVQLPPMPAVNDSAARTLCSVAHSQRPFWPAVAEPHRLAKEPLDVVRRVMEQRGDAAVTAESTTAAPEEVEKEGPPVLPRTAWQPEPETKPHPEPEPKMEPEPELQPEPQPEAEPLERLVDRLTLAEDQGTGAAAAGDLVVEGSPERDAKPVTAPAGEGEKATPPEKGQPGKDATPAEGQTEKAAAPPATVKSAWAERAAEASGLSEQGAVAAALAAGDAALQQFLVLEEISNQNMYAVVPLLDCPHLCTVADLPVGGINASALCADCGDSQENWVCLTCYQVCCGRYRSCHMLDHGAVTGHCMVLSLADLTVWCYVCENYIHHERLTAAKRSAHHSKFGVDMPGGDAGHA
ncbi:histone deacetylase 6-like [Amphibalanus amphitrite]|uniref:histone deacetylase 6-like n=1 Tax=Amphibalanus amphitrite TaxID=1232801 RepID=UPI001C9110A5|nr:histone deacetylase 6-like [Amphibalanus amphitrite]